MQNTMDYIFNRLNWLERENAVLRSSNKFSINLLTFALGVSVVIIHYKNKKIAKLENAKETEEE